MHKTVFERWHLITDRIELFYNGPRDVIGGRVLPAGSRDRLLQGICYRTEHYWKPLGTLYVYLSVFFTTMTILKLFGFDFGVPEDNDYIL